VGLKILEGAIAGCPTPGCGPAWDAFAKNTVVSYDQT